MACSVESPSATTVGAFDFYHIACIPLLLLALFLGFVTRPQAKEVIPDGFRNFQYRFLIVWYVAVAAQWLQGPYTYKMYQSYDFTSGEINTIFAFGFLAALVFSFVAGAGADYFGRKRFCILYCVCQICACGMVHIRSYWILVLGSVISGAATTILYSIFECWLVSEHKQHYKFSQTLLSYNFGLMFSGKYVVAVVCGIIGQVLVAVSGTCPVPMGTDSVISIRGYLVPFQLTMALMVVAIPLIALLWDENYGQEQDRNEVAVQSGLGQLFRSAFRVMASDIRVPMVTLAGALFEAALHVFVVTWIPALHTKSFEPQEPPSGTVFVAYMLCLFCGASSSALLEGHVSAPRRLMIAFAVAAGALGISAGTVWQDQVILTFAAFLVFEFCVGIYFPVIGMVKAEVVPEHVRGTVYSAHRVLMNAFVLIILVADFHLVYSFTIAAVLLIIAVFCLSVFMCARPPISLSLVAPLDLQRVDKILEFRTTPAEESLN